MSAQPAPFFVGDRQAQPKSLETVKSLQVDPLEIILLLRQAQAGPDSKLRSRLRALLRSNAPLVVQSPNVEIATLVARLLPCLTNAHSSDVCLLRGSEKFPQAEIPEDTWVILQDVDLLGPRQQAYWLNLLTKTNPSLCKRLIVISQFGFTHALNKKGANKNLVRLFGLAVLKLASEISIEVEEMDLVNKVRKSRSEEHVEKLLQVLKKCNGNISLTARMLGMSRGAVRYQVKKFQLLAEN